MSSFGQAVTQRLGPGALNHRCFCCALDRDLLASTLDAELGRAGLADLVRQRNPNLFAAQPVFVSASHRQRIAQVIAAIHSVVALPAYQQRVLDDAPAIVRLGPRDGLAGPRGVFFGYDFHVSQDRLGLIEVNTNAGGAMLNAVLARAQRACCQALGWLVPGADEVDRFEQHIVDMFRSEWRLSGRDRPLASIAIVDDNPPDQYLYPEFLLFQSLFERHGITAVIADPSELVWRGGALWHGERRIDLVYNRLTDFMLSAPSSAALREAWDEQGVVLTPHPRAHALYADKRRLVLFSDDAQLAELGAPAAVRELLRNHVPRTEVVTPDAAPRLWADRRGLFFKPASGFGSRAAYRGDKLTHKVWQQILAGEYVAQTLVAPGERMLGPAPAAAPLKFDLRAYAYDGVSQWLAARLYQGQTTNFRTPGGGFAPVFSLPLGAVTGL